MRTLALLMLFAAAVPALAQTGDTAPIAAPAAIATATPSPLARELDDLIELMRSQNITTDLAAASTAVLEALARSVDPAARVLDNADAAHVRQEHEGADYALGLRITMSNAMPVVVHVAPGSPAASHGILPGDTILAIDGEPATNTTLPAATARLRAHKPTPVDLALHRDSTNPAPTGAVARALVPVHAIETAEKWPRDLAYMKINGLFPGAVRDIIPVLRSWAQAGRYGIILDLRGAGGSCGDSVAAIASLFAPSGALLYSLRDRDDQDLASVIAIEGDTLDTPVVALIDEQTSGASELLAATLKDSARGAVVIGTPTSGDPMVREYFDLPGARQLYIATRRVATADGTVYDGIARVEPDLLADKPSTPADDYEPEPMPDRRETLDEEVTDRALRDRIRGDAPLRRAVDLLLGLKAIDPRFAPNSRATPDRD